MDNLRRAILLFTAVVFVAVGVVGFMLALDYNNASESKIKDINYEGEKYVPSEKNDDVDAENAYTENILVIIGDEQNKTAEIISVLNFDSEKKSVNMLCIPCDTKYSLEEGSGSSFSNGVLKDYYKKAGGEKMTLTVSGMLNIAISRYIYMDFSDFASLVNHFSSREGGVLFDMPVSIYSETQGSVINVSKGQQRFDGALAKQLASFVTTDDGIYKTDILKYYDGTENCRVKMMAEFTRAFLNQSFFEPADSYYTENFYSLIYSVKSGFETNVPDEEFMKISKNIGAFKKNNGSFYIGELLPGKDLSVSLLVKGAEPDLMSESEITRLISESFISNS